MERPSVDLPTPAIIAPIELWTGKQVFGMLVRPKASDQVFVNLEVAEKSYGKVGKHMCPRDGYVCVQNSEIMCGQLGKATLGGGNKTGLFYVLNSEYGPEVTASAMNRRVISPRLVRRDWTASSAFPRCTMCSSSHFSATTVRASHS